jgi:hypothetical protein
LSTCHIAVIRDTTELDVDELHQVCAAISVQVARDFGPVWSVSATVDPFMSEAQVPQGAGYWNVYITTSDDPGEGGYHNDPDNQPVAYVKYGDDVALRASHEILEMLADPYGSRLLPGLALDGSGNYMNYLVEVCDPCEALTYSVNGLNLAEFCTPDYYNSNGSAPFSFHKWIQQPYQVLEGGYLSWQDPAGKQWWQLQYFGNQPQTVQVDGGDLGIRSLRERMDTAARRMRSAHRVAAGEAVRTAQR